MYTLYVPVRTPPYDVIIVTLYILGVLADLKSMLMPIG